MFDSSHYFPDIIKITIQKLTLSIFLFLPLEFSEPAGLPHMKLLLDQILKCLHSLYSVLIQPHLPGTSVTYSHCANKEYRTRLNALDTVVYQSRIWTHRKMIHVKDSASEQTDLSTKPKPLCYH